MEGSNLPTTMAVLFLSDDAIVSSNLVSGTVQRLAGDFIFHMLGCGYLKL